MNLNFKQPKEISHDPTLIALLVEFSEIFLEPSSLPPPRTHDHRIPLQENSQPISIRPYQYALP